MVTSPSPIVFISYSHDSPEHRDRVLALSERLRRDGFDTRLDSYVNGAPATGWPRWTEDQLDAADCVLIVCTETYHRRFRGHELGTGKGVDFEGALITQDLYDERSHATKFVPVLFTEADRIHIPRVLRGRTHYTLDSEASYEHLCDFLLGRAGVEPGPIGPLKLKPRAMGHPLEFGAPGLERDDEFGAAPPRASSESGAAEVAISPTCPAAYLFYVARERVATLFQQVDARTLASLAARERQFLPFGEPGASFVDDRARRAVVSQLAAVLQHLAHHTTIGDLEADILEKGRLDADWYRVRARFTAEAWDPSSSAVTLHARVGDYQLSLSCSKRNIAGVIEDHGVLSPTSVSSILFSGSIALLLRGVVKLAALDREQRVLRGTALCLIMDPLIEDL